jgi:prostaglandin-endoperoxide synthase 2
VKRDPLPVVAPAALPGGYGWPLLGWLYDTLDFFVFSGWKKFFLRRRDRYKSNVFRCHALMKTVAVLDHQAFEPFVSWDGRLAKEDGFGWAKVPPALAGNVAPSVFASGDQHDKLKAFYRALLESRAPQLGASFRAVAAEYFGRWEQGRPFAWRDEIERFYATFFFEWLLGARPEPDDVRLVYNNLFGHLLWPITRALPWSKYSRSVRAYGRLLDLVTKSPLFRPDGRLGSREETAKQLLFTIGVNCYLGLQSLTRSAVGELSGRDIAALRAEVAAAVGNAPDIEPRALAGTPGLDAFLKEVLRLHPPVFFIFGRATADFVVSSGTGQYAVERGEMLMGVIPLAQRNPALFDDFDRFDPAHGARPGSEAAMVWAHGTPAMEPTAQNRMCAGPDFGLRIAKLFCATLLRTYEWRLKRPARWNDHLFTLNVAAPRGKLEVGSFARLGAAPLAAAARTNRTTPWFAWAIRAFPWIVDWVQAVPFLRRFFNRLSVNFLVNRSLFRARIGMHRPYPFTLWTPNPQGLDGEPYVSWTGLFDRTYTGRHLPPDPAARRRAGVDEVAQLFRRPAFTADHKSSALFSFFAQWFTDSFLRTDPSDPRRNTSNHEIDLCQIYGLDAATTSALREHRAGRLRTLDGQGLFPDRLFDASGNPQPHFRGLPYVQRQANDPEGRLIIDALLARGVLDRAELARRRPRLYASGLERGNSSVLYAALSTVFVREHNRICGVLERAHPGWDDDRLFETARNINIALVLRVIVEDYINHIADERFKFLFDYEFAERTYWYRTNRIMLEFNLLYRWHSLVPDTLLIGGATRPPAQFMVNNRLLEEQGVEAVIAAASRQPAGRIGLGNTAQFLFEAEKRALQFARDQRVQPFNEYCRRFRLPVCRSFDELTGDPALADGLARLYGSVDDVEFLVGLYAERHAGMLGDLMRAMVALDAFSHALTNPLLSRNVFPHAFDAQARSIIDETRSLADIVERNKAPGSAAYCSFAL